MADADIILGGFGLFGGRGEYTAKIKVRSCNAAVLFSKNLKYNFNKLEF